MSNGLVALSSAVVLAVYSTGYLRTQAAADRFAADTDQRRQVAPAAIEARVPAAPAVSGAAPAPPVAPADTAPAPASAAPAPPHAAPPVTAALPPAATSTGATAMVPAAATSPDTPRASAAQAPIANVATAPSVVLDSAVASPATPTTTVAASTTTAALTTPTPAALEAAAPAGPVYKDGTYTGWGTSRHGDIEAEVIIADGRITSATIAQCFMRWPCSWIEKLPPQVVERQSAETDFVSGATQSTNAFYYAVVQALGKAALP